ncbi:MAG: tetratricopeptide repeat protein [Hyphomicrobiales bacterium]
MNRLILAGASALILSFATPAAFAAGSGTTSTGGASAAKPACAAGTAFSSSANKCVSVCKNGQVFDAKKNKCVKKSADLSDPDIKAQGWALAYAGDYQSAIEVFRMAANQSDPEVLNGLGYSHRKMGKVEEGIAYYGKALAADPNYVLAREYLGEGYVAAGRIDLAKQQLSEIGNRCGTACESYLELAMTITAAEAKSN